MDILAIPFHRFLNIKRNESDDFIFKIDERPEYSNHLGTVHACVQLSLAEASSGEFLLNQFDELKNELIPVVRKTEVKYHKPANGELFSKAAFLSTNKQNILKELNSRKRSLVQVKVEIYDTEKNKAATAIFDWFIIKK